MAEIHTIAAALRPLADWQCSRKRGQPLKKRKKSCFLDFEKKT